MKLRAALVALALALIVESGTPAGASKPEVPPPKHTTYTVVTRAGIVVNVAALEWIPRRAKTVLLAIHGSAGVKENNWAPLPVRGYSFAASRFSERRAVVAIDLPAYGKSEGDRDLVGMEDYAFVIAQIAQDLRGRFTKVVGVGHSVGGGLVDAAQGMFRSFDAIIPASWSHGGYSTPYKNTCGQQRCPNVRGMFFVASRADPRVINAFIKPLQGFSDEFALNIAIWGGLFTRPSIGPSLDDVTTLVDVPVLVVLGANDFFWDTTKFADERSHFPLAGDVTVLVLPKTGHAVFHHLNHASVEGAIGRWLTERRL
jgi:pimeloyl-ACP methyl ester carboxylesterase